MAERINQNLMYLYELGEVFTEREIGLIGNCKSYANGDKPSGLPGHNLMLIIDRYDRVLTELSKAVDEKTWDKALNDAS